MLNSNIIKPELSKEIVIEETSSFCSFCLKIIPAKIIEKNGKIYLKKKCCNEEIVLIENDSEYYRKAILPFFNKISSNLENSQVIKLTLTSKCNISCPICYRKLYPSNIFHDFDVSLDEIKVEIKKHKSKIIDITGGEPTTRKDLPEIIREIVKSGNIPFLATNGLKLSNKNYVRKLKLAGLKLVALSFDGFSDDIYEKFRGKKLLINKLQALKNLKEEGMQVLLASTIVKNINEDQIPLILKFAFSSNNFIKDIYFLEHYTGEHENEEEKITGSDIFKIAGKTINIDLLDLVKEENRFRSNIYKLSKKFLNKKIQKNFSMFLGNEDVHLKIINGKPKPLFSIEKLKKINIFIEEILRMNKFESIFYIIKNLKIIFDINLIDSFFLLLLNKFNFLNFYLNFSSRNILRVKIGKIRTPLNYNLNQISMCTNFMNPVPVLQFFDT